MTSASEPPSTPAAMRARIAADPYGRWLGVELLELGPGHCRVALTIGPHLANFHGRAHGGVIFSLADLAFGAACNAHGEEAVALTVTVQFHRAVAPGARLVAEARAARQGRRAGFYAMTVTDGEGTVVATCQAVALRAAPPGRS